MLIHFITIPPGGYGTCIEEEEEMRGQWCLPRHEANCSLDHLETLVKSREVRIQGLEQQARVHMFMEGAWLVRTSFILCECIH